MNQRELPITPDTLIDRVFRASKELADALAAYRLLQSRLEQERPKRQSVAADASSAPMPEG